MWTGGRLQGAGVGAVVGEGGDAGVTRETAILCAATPTAVAQSSLVEEGFGGPECRVGAAPHAHGRTTATATTWPTLATVATGASCATGASRRGVGNAAAGVRRERSVARTAGATGPSPSPGATLAPRAARATALSPQRYCGEPHIRVHQKQGDGCATTTTTLAAFATTAASTTATAATTGSGHGLSGQRTAPAAAATSTPRARTTHPPASS